MQNVVAVYHSVCTYVSGSKYFEDAGVTLLAIRTWLTP